MPTITDSRRAAAAVACAAALAAGVLTASCADRGRPPAEETGRAAERVQEDLERAGEDLQEAGEEVAAGARRLGAALDREAERLNREIEPRLEDAVVATKVKARLAADPEVNPFQIDVDVIDGVVTLSGVVESDYERREAEELARRTEGAEQVINNLRVGRRG